MSPKNNHALIDLHDPNAKVLIRSPTFGFINNFEDCLIEKYLKKLFRQSETSISGIRKVEKAWYQTLLIEEN